MKGGTNKMKKNYDFGNCAKCGRKIISLGGEITSEELLVCKECSDKHSIDLVNELEKFRRSEGFNSILSLRKKILWVSEQKANWNDNADKSFMESVTDYNDWNITELRSAIIECEITLLEEVIYEDLLEEKEKVFNSKDKERDNLRRELKALLRKLNEK